MAITHERTGERRPALWDARTGEVAELALDLTGAVEPVGLVAGRLGAPAPAGRRAGTGSTATTSRSGDVTTLATEPGSITAAAVRPDGAVWYRGHNGEHPARLLAVGSAAPLLEADGPAGAGRAAVRGVVVRRTRTASGSTASSSAPTARARTR